MVGFLSIKENKGSYEGMIIKECLACQGMKIRADICQIVSMHVKECLGVSGNHKGELGQSAWK